MHIRFNGIKNENFRFDQAGGRPVTCISPFAARPNGLPTYHEIWLDTNIISQTSQDPNPNIQKLIQTGIKNGFSINPMLALAEFNRLHDPMTAMDMMLNRIPRMEEVYGFHFDMQKVTEASARLILSKSQDLDYVKNISDMTIILKYFYSIPNWSFSQKLEGYAKLVNSHLPNFLVMFYVACLYFFAKHNKKMFAASIGKIDQAMNFFDSAEKNRKSSDNHASDIAMFTQTSAYPISPPPTKFRIPYIATSDEGMALLLREIAYFSVDADKGNGYPGFRLDGIIAQNFPEVFNTIYRKYMIGIPIELNRLDNLREIAESILAGEFDHKKF